MALAAQNCLKSLFYELLARSPDCREAGIPAPRFRCRSILRHLRKRRLFSSRCAEFFPFRVNACSCSRSSVFGRTTYFFTEASLADMIRSRRILAAGANHAGHRDFDAFLNRYRIDEARAALSDPSQREAQGADHRNGRRSIGPFHHAFKAGTGMTPTEFRRHDLVRSQTAASRSNDKFKIGQSR
jgi:AraC-like DNA-binding protein